MKSRTSRPQPSQSRMVQVKGRIARKGCVSDAGYRAGRALCGAAALGANGPHRRARRAMTAPACARWHRRWPAGVGLVLRSNSLPAAEYTAQVEYLAGQWAMVQDKARQLTAPATLLPARPGQRAAARPAGAAPRIDQRPGLYTGGGGADGGGGHPFAVPCARQPVKGLERRVH